jgi:hypothetical protein
MAGRFAISGHTDSPELISMLVGAQTVLAARKNPVDGFAAVNPVSVPHTMGSDYLVVKGYRFERVTDLAPVRVMDGTVHRSCLKANMRTSMVFRSTNIERGHIANSPLRRTSRTPASISWWWGPTFGT